MKDNAKKTVFLFILIVYVIILIIGALITIPDNSGAGNNDKLMHFIEFFGLSLIIVKTLQLYNVKFNYLLTFFISCFLALISEAVQLATINRTFSIYDLLFDIIGIITGLIIFKLVVSKWKF
jgi:VanZ family protein